MRDEQLFDPERRGTDRFPIESELRYKLVENKEVTEPGTGRTLNMSSKGILFTTATRLPLGRRVELSVDWPAQLSETCGLKLVALGRVVRSSAEVSAIRIDKYDFRTRATARLKVAASAN
jgi:PilZ domain